MSPAEKIILTKVKENLNRSLYWNGTSTDWTGFANQLKNSIKDSMGLIEGLLQIPEKEKQQKQQTDPAKPITLDDLIG